MVPPPSPAARSIREFFSRVYSENLVKLLEAKLTKMWGVPMTDWVCPEIGLSLACRRLQHFVSFASSSPALAPTEVAAGEFLPGELWFTVATHLSHSFWR